ncbi:T9SS type A sorting domain-containing protein [Microvirga sp. STR05]|uniref:T9SS type A sorting domain-containing protein n=1 Tax=Hymenobacter duratus TaxID=2771356 RepID=A0ABR8JFZ3_9BACT|nr:T9SS type A sorting domain-containing protein [Hymenobacter duratus]MBD2715785.1 T9SS type A sorting domain-containing protein [Hymenobacter duratus]MBR7950696.1 T9SS type A sorting domain-containing protein [Microvirga sp. STR05]
MKKLYPLLILCACLCGLRAPAQNWRPFRPNGDVHAFRGASADTILTLRLDSAGVIGSDSVYYFNHIMRRASSYQWQKSRNNQFGQQMRYNSADRTYMLFWNGGTVNGFSLDYGVVMKPFARVGTTWQSLNLDVGVTTTLVSRGTALIDGVQDSVVTFRVGTPGVNVVLSKNYGLVSAPQNLRFYAPGAPMLTLARRPAPAGLSYYNPLTLLDLQPGDELGYEQEPIMIVSFPCYQGWLLRKVLTRQVTPDSVVYRFQQQSKISYSNAPGCFGTGTTLSPVTTVRMSASRRTGRWAGNQTYANSQARLVNPDLLAYEYRVLATSSNSLMMGYPVVATRPGVACSGPALLRQEVLYGGFGSNTYTYTPGIDAAGWNQLVAEGVGPVMQYEYRLSYSRRTAGGSVQTCGSRTDFATLLPTKAAQRAATFQLYPNPAAETATLTLPAPARVATTVRVLDNLGRAVLIQQLAAGQTTTTLPLQRLAGGLYVVEVQAPGEAPQHLRLQH